MELRVLRYFLAATREQTISGAAQYLHVSQPSLSRQLMDLEKELGQQLFVRGNRRITLTEAGELLRRRADELVLLADKTEAELRSMQEVVSGDVYIGGGETEAMRLIARAARDLQAAHPHICYHLYSGNADDVTERLDKGLLDFGLLIEPFDKQKYDFIRLPVSDRWGVLMRRDSPLAERQTICPADLRDLPLIISRQSMVLHALADWFDRPIEELHVAATYNLLFNASLMVEEGVGYALCLDHLVHTGPDSALCFRPLSPTQQAGIGIVWKKYQVFSKAAAKFLEHVQSLHAVHDGV